MYFIPYTLLSTNHILVHFAHTIINFRDEFRMTLLVEEQLVVFQYCYYYNRAKVTQIVSCIIVN